MTKEGLIEHFNGRCPFNIHNGIRLVELEEDFCVVEAGLTAQALNSWGMAHGGLVYSVCDFAAGVIASQGKTCVTQSGSIYYLRPCMGSLIRAEGRIVKRGRTVTLVETNVYDDEGRHCARGEFQIYKLDEK